MKVLWSRCFPHRSATLFLMALDDLHIETAENAQGGMYEGRFLAKHETIVIAVGSDREVIEYSFHE